MRVAVHKASLKRILRWTQRVLFACAVSALGYCAFALLDSWIFQNRERRHLEQLRPAASHASTIIPPVAAALDSLIGRLEIRRLGLSVIVIEGTGRTTLRRAVGHIPGTALPGQPGNVGIAGHRDTFFRPLRNIREADIITLTTPLAEYRYRVLSITIVSPTDVAMLDPSDTEILTLVTCYPFYFVGSAPERFIVRAQRINRSA